MLSLHQKHCSSSEVATRLHPDSAPGCSMNPTCRPGYKVVGGWHSCCVQPLQIVQSTIAGHVTKPKDQHLAKLSQVLFNLLQTMLSKTLSQRSMALHKHQGKLWDRGPERPFRCRASSPHGLARLASAASSVKGNTVSGPLRQHPALLSAG